MAAPNTHNAAAPDGQTAGYARDGSNPSHNATRSCACPSCTRPCQRCQEVAPYCDCPRFLGEPHMECQACGALEGQHLLDFAYGTDRLICPAPTRRKAAS